MCSSCFQKRIPCVFDSEEGLRPVQLWRVRHQKATEEAADYKELIDNLRNATEEESQVLLRRIRASEDGVVVDEIKTEDRSHGSTPFVDGTPDGHSESGDTLKNHQVDGARGQFQQSAGSVARKDGAEGAANLNKSYEEAMAEVEHTRRRTSIHPSLQRFDQSRMPSALVQTLKTLQNRAPTITTADRPFHGFAHLPRSGVISGFPDNHMSRLQLPVHLMKPLELEDNSPLSSVYTGFRRAANDMLASGTPVSAVMGPDFVVVDLFFRDRQPADSHTICSWASELCKNFADFDVFSKLAQVFFLSSYMRVRRFGPAPRANCSSTDTPQWMLVPNLQNYARLPEPIRPTPRQRLVPHIPALQLAPQSVTTPT